MPPFLQGALEPKQTHTFFSLGQTWLVISSLVRRKASYLKGRTSFFSPCKRLGRPLSLSESISVLDDIVSRSTLLLSSEYTRVSLLKYIMQSSWYAFWSWLINFYTITIIFRSNASFIHLIFFIAPRNRECKVHLFVFWSHKSIMERQFKNFVCRCLQDQNLKYTANARLKEIPR